MKTVLIYRSQLLARSETFIRQQALALRHWRPVIVGQRRIADGLDLEGLKIHLLRQESPKTWAGLYGRLRSRSSLLGRETVRHLSDIDADLVHVHFGTDAVDIWPWLRPMDLPVLVTLHGFDITIEPRWWEAGHGGEARRSYPRALRQLAQEERVTFIAVSESIRAAAMAFGIPPDKIVVSYIGIDTDQFRPGDAPLAQRSKRLLFVGRLVEKKGVEYLLRAFAKFVTEEPGAELVLIGDGPLRKNLVALARDLRIEPKFLGALPSEEILVHMRSSRALCLPSVTAENGDAEGLPIVILEAQACGLPVITSARGAVGEAVIDNRNGYTFSEKDVVKLARLLKMAMTSDTETSNIAASARQDVKQNFSLDRCTKQLEEIYDVVVSR